MNTKDILNSNNFVFKKKFGQNFLLDQNILNNIVKEADITKDTLVIEIGVGAAALTKKLSLKAKTVLGYEIDETLKEPLNVILNDFSNVDIIFDDFLNRCVKDDLKKYEYKTLMVVANLPYYITTPIIMRFLEEVLPFETMVFMIQKEVANRMNALPGGKEYGSLSVAVQYYCNTSIVTKVPKGAFIPEPGVDSAVIRLDLKEDKGIDLIDEDLFFEVVKAAFSKRRKTLLNALSSFGSIGGKEEAKSALQMADIDPSRRGETLDIKEFAALSNAYAGILSR